MDLEKLATVTYSQFVFISISVNPFTLIFGVEMYYIEGNMHTKFQPKMIFHLGEKLYCHLQPFVFYLDIGASIYSDFWCGDVIFLREHEHKISSKINF